MGLYRAPDNMVRKLRAYDPGLSLTWSDRNEWWEVWYTDPQGKTYLVTPIVETIYVADGKKRTTSLDERIIAWLYSADTWLYNSSEEAVDRLFNSELKKEYEKYKKKRAALKDAAKDTYNSLANFYLNKGQKKNPKHINPFNKQKEFGKWVRPDIQFATSRRLFGRSKKNARLKFGL